MDLKNFCPENIIKLSASVSLVLIDKYDLEELNVIKNILCSVSNNISSYQSQCYINKNYKKKKWFVQKINIFVKYFKKIIDKLLIIRYNIIVWSHGQAVKTPPFHGGIRGSIPLGTTIILYLVYSI